MRASWWRINFVWDPGVVVFMEPEFCCFYRERARHFAKACGGRRSQVAEIAGGHREMLLHVMLYDVYIVYIKTASCKVEAHRKIGI